MKYDTIDDLRLAWERNDVSRLDFVAHARALITRDNVDDIVQAMPNDVYLLFLRVVLGIAEAEDGATVELGRGAPLGATSDVSDILRTWLARDWPREGVSDEPAGCNTCPSATLRFNGGNGATTCGRLSNRIVAIGHQLPRARPTDCPLPARSRSSALPASGEWASFDESPLTREQLPAIYDALQDAEEVDDD